MAILLALLAGCSVDRWRTLSSRNPDPAEERIRVTYRTQCDRLVAPGTETLLASFSAPSPQPIPAMTVGTVDIRYPHPGGIPDKALVTVTFESQTDFRPEVAGRTRFRTRISRGDPPERAAPEGAIRERWAMDLPKWQLDAILEDLRQQKYFLRSKTLSPESHLVTEIRDVRLRKDFLAVESLDAMIVRVREQGRCIDRQGHGVNLAASSPPDLLGQHVGRLPASAAIR